MKRLMVFTGGGLAPALNATLYGVISAARERGYNVVGGLFGWASLLRNGRQITLDEFDIEPIRNIGGTFLRSSRTNPFALVDGMHQVKERLQALRIDAVVAIGGDDTLGAAAELAREGVAVVGIPKTIDNDLAGTYFTPGYPSAAKYLSSFAAEIKEDAAYALSRIFVIESLGMKAGWLSLAAAYGHADVIIPPEQPVSLNNVINVIDKTYVQNGNFAVVVVAQEAHFDQPLERLSDHQLTEQYGHIRHSYICLALKDKIKKELGVDTKALYPGNFLETGAPTILDRDLATLLGRHAVKLVFDGRVGTMATIVRPDEKKLTLEVSDVALSAIVGKQNYRVVPPGFFDYNTFQPTAEFFNYAEPLLGKYEPKDDLYTRLIKKVASQAG